MRILVTRFSAMGDVALTTTVVNAFIKKYPEHELVFITRDPFQSFFKKHKNLKIITPSLNKKDGIFAFLNLIGIIDREGPYDIYIDLHNNLRTFFLRAYFFFKGLRTFKLNKKRQQKRDIIQHKNRSGLDHITLQYAEVFERAGFPIRLEHGNQFGNEINVQKNSIGVAPFAKHVLKEWGIEKMNRIIHHFLSKGNDVYVFGGKENEHDIFSLLEKHKGLKRPPSKNLSEELAFISTLDLMISMDSSNMHFAALSGVKILSIWGPTHPLTGFGPYDPSKAAIILPSKDILCNPCSVYGNKPCRTNDHACMNSIKEEEVIIRAELLLGKQGF